MYEFEYNEIIKFLFIMVLSDYASQFVLEKNSN